MLQSPQLTENNLNALPHHRVQVGEGEPSNDSNTRSEEGFNMGGFWGCLAIRIVFVEGILWVYLAGTTCGHTLQADAHS